MAIVVTGGAGFIGRHLVERLCQDGMGVTSEPVVVLDNMRRGSREALAPLIADGRVRLIEGDVRDADAIRKAVTGAETIFHLAAQANVMGSESDPDYAFGTNVTGTYNLLEAAQETGVRRIVFASSREVYGQPPMLPVPEDAPFAPKNAYGATKAAGEMACRAASMRGLEVVALRLANVYGPGDFGRVIPLWLEHAARGEDLPLYGGGQVLDLVWVGDVVDAMLRAAQTPRQRFAARKWLEASDEHGFFVALNIGTGEGTPITTLAERIRQLAARDIRVQLLPGRAVEVERYVADITRARTVLGYEPQSPLAHLPRLAQLAFDVGNTSAVAIRSIEPVLRD
jgi:UDP-glucose 4-epimerase